MFSLLLSISILVACALCVHADILVFPIDGRFVEQEFRDVPSTFGNGLPYEGLRGMITYANPADACTTVSPPPKSPPTPNRTGRWVLLCARRNCSFEQKVRTAQAAGYDAVVVHNVGSDALQPMSADNSTGIHIPSVFVGEMSGIILREVYANVNFFIIINSDVPFNINTHLLLPFAIVAGICFIVMVIFMVVKCIKDRRRQRRHILPSAALNKIPTCKFQKGDPYETCAICLDDYIEGEKLRVLPCAHAYHTKCIDPWLTKNRRVCPVCKRRVFAHDETPYPDSDDSDGDTNTDDRTPLVRANRQGTQGGTFDESTSINRINPALLPSIRAARSISQQSEATNYVMTASDHHHSINLVDNDLSSDDNDDDDDDHDDRDTRADAIAHASTDLFTSSGSGHSATRVIVKGGRGGATLSSSSDSSSNSSEA